jgi:hypothetical protein
LAQCDEIDVGLFVEPSPAHDELLTEISEVSDWTAEGSQTELEKNQQDFEGRARGSTAP